jgi:hypothetical protein
MKSIACQSFRRRLLRLNLADPLPEALSRHLAGCESCRKEWNRLRDLHHLMLSSSSGVEIPVSDEDAASARFFGAVGSAPAAQRAHAIRKRGAILAASLAVVTATAAYLDSNRSDRRAVPTLPHPIPLIERAEKPRIALKDEIGAAQTERRIDKADGASPSQTMHPSSRPDTRERLDQNESLAQILPRTPIESRFAQSTVRPWKGKSSGHLDDLSYMNAPTRDALKGMLIPLRPATPTRPKTWEQSLQTGDDFITILKPELAMVTSRATNPLIRDAIQGYEAETHIVDPKLAATIGVQLKGEELGDLLRIFSQAVGEPFSIDPAFEHLKITLFTDDEPVRDLMREIVQIYNLNWTRLPNDDGYAYRLTQNAETHAAEQAWKLRDKDQALLDALNEIQPYISLLGASRSQLESMQADADHLADSATLGSVKVHARMKARTLGLLKNDGDFRDSVRILSRLTVDQWLQLQRDGRLDIDGDSPDSPIQLDIIHRLQRETWDENISAKTVPTPALLNEFKVSVHFTLEPQGKEAVVLKAGWETRNPSGTIDRKSPPVFITRGFSNLMNATPSERGISTPPNWEGNDRRITLNVKYDSPYGPRSRFIDPENFFEALHEATGYDILSDDYDQMRNFSELEFHDESIKDILDQASDALGAQWEIHDNLLIFQRVDFYYHRDKIIPNYLLEKWSRSIAEYGHLTLDDLTEASALPRETLEDPDLATLMRVKYCIRDWDMIPSARNVLRIYALLDAEQQQQAQSPEGLSIFDPSPEIMDAIVNIGYWKREDFRPHPSVRIYIHLQQPGQYEWIDWRGRRKPPFPVTSTIIEPTLPLAEKALETYLKSQDASDDQIMFAKDYIMGGDMGLNVLIQADDYLFRLYSTGGKSVANTDMIFH